jgi:hypothetical protein
MLTQASTAARMDVLIATTSDLCSVVRALVDLFSSNAEVAAAVSVPMQRAEAELSGIEVTEATSTSLPGELSSSQQAGNAGTGGFSFYQEDF